MQDTLSTKDAAALLGVCDSRVRQMIYAGELQAEKVGASWRIEPGEAFRVARIRVAHELTHVP